MLELAELRTPALGSLQREMNRLWEDFFSPRHRIGNGGPSLWQPALDVEETPDTIRVQVDLPGVDPKHVEVSVRDRYLTIVGERPEERREEKGHNWYRCERSYGRFERSLLLPATVDENSATAESHDGVVTITLQKSAEAKQHRIPVKVK